MKKKWELLFIEVQKVAVMNPEIAGVLALLLLILLFKKPKIMFGLGFFLGLGLSVWFWFTSSYEGRNQNKKFQRYENDQVEKRVGKQLDGE